MKAFVQSLLRPFGLRLARIDDGTKRDFGASVLFDTLERLGFLPRHVLDVGANHGNWTRCAVQFFPDAQYTLVEPQEYLKMCVQDLIDPGYKIRWLNLGAADQSGVMSFHILDRDDGSTFLPREQLSPSRIADEKMVQVKTLNDIVSTHGLPTPDLVKIDAEGFDLKVIQGASDLIGKTEVFLLEAGVTCPFENSVACAVTTMEALGYRLIDITELNRSPKHNVLWLTELAFLRSASPLLARVTS